MTLSLTDNQRAIADSFIAQWAPRTDAYSEWTGDQWVAVKAPLTPEVLASSMSRRDPGPPISAYFPDREGMTHVAALDFDTEDGLREAHRVAQRLYDNGITVYVEPSRRGAHLWWPFAQPEPAWFVRRVLRGALRLSEIQPNPKIEYRPAMNGAPQKGGLGHALRMPLQRHPLTGESKQLMHVERGPLPPTLADLLLAMDEPTSHEFLAVIAKWAPVEMSALDPSARPPKTYSERQSPRAAAPTVSEVAHERWGVTLVPGKANHCFAPGHDDKHPSLSVTRDDERLVCKRPDCIFNNNDRGYGSIELSRLAL